MAQSTTKRPEVDTHWVCADPKKRLYELYLLVPRLIGTAVFEGPRRWVTDDRSVLQSKDECEERIIERESRSMRGLDPGAYVVRARSVTQADEKIMIKLQDGQDIVIHTKG